MTNQEILTKVILKTISNGWLPYFASFNKNMRKSNIIIRFPEGSSSVNFDYQMKGHIVGVGGYSLEPYSIIFNHDFAKALWGEGLVYAPTGERIFSEPGQRVALLHPTLKAYEYHLQQMVIADDPIKYLNENIND